MEYPIIRNKPVAQFWYKGTHSHPVKRTVLITEQTKDYFKGYEVREGTQFRVLGERFLGKPISFVAKVGDYVSS
jgi:hypothetical protein